MQGKALQDFVIDKIDDLKGQDIVAIDVHGKSSITDCMIICTGTSTRHVMSIADDCIAIFVKQFLQSSNGGCSLAAENNSLLCTVNGLRAILLPPAKRPGYLVRAAW